MSSESIYLHMGEPEIYGHTLYGFLFSVAQEKDIPWIYSHFIQVLYKKDWGMMVYQDHLNLIEECPFLSGTNIRVDGDEKKTTEYFLEVLKKALKNGYYISLFLDWKIVNPYYGGKSFAHSAIISGYNLEEEKFVIYDNFKEGKFTRIEVDCDIVAKAFYMARFSSVGNESDNNGSGDFDYLKDITLVSYEKYVFTDFDLESITNQVDRYLDSSGYVFGNGPEEDIWGLHSYDSLSSLIGDKRQKEVRDLHFLYEHKLLMLKRMKKINSVYSLKIENVIGEFENICRESKILRNLFIKNVVLKRDCSKEIVVLKEKILEIKKQEVNSLLKFKEAIVRNQLC